MWDLKEPSPVKLLVGILAADKNCLNAAIETLTAEFTNLDLQSDIWPFTQTDYYNNETPDK